MIMWSAARWSFIGQWRWFWCWSLSSSSFYLLYYCWATLKGQLRFSFLPNSLDKTFPFYHHNTLTDTRSHTHTTPLRWHSAETTRKHATLIVVASDVQWFRLVWRMCVSVSNIFLFSFLFRPIFGGRQKCSTLDYFFVFSLTGPTVLLFVCSCRFLLQYFCCCWWSVSFCRTNSENSCLPAEMMVTQFSHYRTWIYYVCCVVFVRKTKWSMCSPLYSVLWCLLLAFATVYSVFYVLCATILSRCANYAR